MPDSPDSSPDKKSGCGLLGAVFGSHGFWLRRTSSAGSLPVVNNNNNQNVDDHNNNNTKLPRVPSNPSSKRRRGGSNDAAASAAELQKPDDRDRAVARPSPNHVRQMPPVYQQHQGRRAGNEGAAARAAPAQNNAQARRVPKEAVTISGELESMIADHQNRNGASATGLVRVSSSNVMMFGNLGNLRQPGGRGGGPLNDLINSHNIEENQNRYGNSAMGNAGKAVAQPYESAPAPPKPSPPPPSGGSLCRAISTRMDPETLKIMGNEDFKSGNFAEALSLYDAAICIDPNKASYRSNKSAALTALGRLLEAVFECREAIRIDPHYHRAHQRLGTLYLRLGEAEKAVYHYKHAGHEADPSDIAMAQALCACLHKCTEAKKQRDWNTLIQETASAMSSGADSAPQMFALQAEALLKLRRHQEADEKLSKGPKFDVEECTRFFGPLGNASLLVIRAQVDMAAGRLDDALAAAQRAVRLDSNNREASAVARRARAVAAARSKGNELFKASRFSEACVAYGEGLELDPCNSVLLCNRAACRSKLGQFEKAGEDCSAALSLRPSYAKARLRRADCSAKLERWEAAVHDYEILVRDSPEDDEVGQALFHAQVQLKKQRGEDVSGMKYEGANAL